MFSDPKFVQAQKFFWTKIFSDPTFFLFQNLFWPKINSNECDPWWEKTEPLNLRLSNLANNHLGQLALANFGKMSQFEFMINISSVYHEGQLPSKFTGPFRPLLIFFHSLEHFFIVPVKLSLQHELELGLGWRELPCPPVGQKAKPFPFFFLWKLPYYRIVLRIGT